MSVEEVDAALRESMFTTVRIKCPIAFAQLFTERCKNEYGDSRWLAVQQWMASHDSIVPHLIEVRAEMELVKHLANKVLEIEEKLKGS